MLQQERELEMLRSRLNDLETQSVSAHVPIGPNGGRRSGASSSYATEIVSPHVQPVHNDIMFASANKEAIVSQVAKQVISELMPAVPGGSPADSDGVQILTKSVDQEQAVTATVKSLVGE